MPFFKSIPALRNVPVRLNARYFVCIIVKIRGFELFHKLFTGCIESIVVSVLILNLSHLGRNEKKHSIIKIKSVENFVRKHFSFGFHVKN